MVEKRFSRDKRFLWWFAKVTFSPLALMFPRVIDMKILIVYTSLPLNGPTRFPLTFPYNATHFRFSRDSARARSAMEIDLEKGLF